MRDQKNYKQHVAQEPSMCPKEMLAHDQGLGEADLSAEDLRKMLENCRQLVNLTNSIILRWDQDGKITFLNQFGQTFFGYCSEEILGRNVVGTIVPETDRAGHDLVQMIRDIGTRPELYIKNQNENMRKNGERVWISWTNKATFDENGNVEEILSVGNDHTETKRVEEELRRSKEELETRVAERTAELQHAYEQLENELKGRKQSEEALRDSQEKYRVLVDKALEGIAVAQDGLLCFANAGAEAICGYKAEELLFKPFTEIIHPDDKDMVLQRHIKRLKGEQFSSRYSFRIVRKDGEVRWVEIDSGMISWEERPAALFFMTDITERKSAEEELESSKERYRTVLESSPDPIVVYDRAGVVTYVNPSFVDTFGWAEHELHGKRTDFVPDEELPKARETLKLLYDGESVPSFDTRRLTKDGRILDIYISAAVLRDAAGEPVGNVVTLRDITQRKAVENALRASEEGKRILIEGSPIGIGIVQDGTYVYVNQTLVTMMGCESPQQIVGSSPLEFIAPEDRNLVLQRGTARLQGLDTPTNYQVKGLSKSGEFADVSIWPRRTEYLGRPALLTFVLDVTQENRLKAQLVQAQKMEAVGTLAGGMAHDFNNMLQVILGYAQLLLIGKDPGSPEYNHLRTIISAGRGGAELIKQLLAFSRKASTRPVPLNLNHRITEIRSLLVRIIPRMIKIELRLKEDIPVIYADPVQMEQILMNLAVNARDAMPEGGTLTIETREVFLDKGFARNHAGAREGRHVMLALSDTGHGMDKQILEHVFEPFYTTKDVGKGTGLGLSMVYGIVKQHSGYISCESQLGHGTAFRIYFPAFDKIEEEQERDDVSLPPGGSETLLLVDDEETVIQLGSEYLRERGYSVLTASNGREALLVYRERQADISLVILDLIMPEIGGKQCLQELRKINPAVRVLVVSGHTSDGTPSEVAALGAKGFVAKPYDMMDLLRAVRETLDTE